jgi:ferredoxin-thioredoxin reductase catalytic subunit
MSKTPAAARDLYTMLRPLQEKKGFFFNSDMGMTLDVLEQLLVTRERYGYMACPCRLANGEYERDRDILCPCAYREADVREFGACYCGLYVSEACARGEIPLPIVPERRPPENIID